MVNQWGFALLFASGTPGGHPFWWANGGFFQHAPSLAANLFGANPKLLENISDSAIILASQAQQQMLGTDVVLTHAPRFFDSQFQHPFGGWSQFDFGEGGAGSRPNHAFDHGLDTADFQPQIAQNTASYSTFFAQ